MTEVVNIDGEWYIRREVLGQGLVPYPSSEAAIEAAQDDGEPVPVIFERHAEVEMET